MPRDSSSKKADEEREALPRADDGGKTAMPLPILEEVGAVAPGVPVLALHAVQTTGSALGEGLRFLHAKVWSIVQDRGLRTVAMISAGPGEGKSTLSIGLAATMAKRPSRRILLIEADLRRPSLETYLGLPKVAGLAEWLAGETQTIRIRRVGPRGFFLMSAGCIPLDHPELLGSQRMEAVLQAVKKSFDLIILDCPPLVPGADAVLLQELVDGFVCVVGSRRTPLEILRRALADLKPERVLGMVLNNHREILPSYQQKAYQQYGLRSRS